MLTSSFKWSHFSPPPAWNIRICLGSDCSTHRTGSSLPYFVFYWNLLKRQYNNPAATISAHRTVQIHVKIKRCPPRLWNSGVLTDVNTQVLTSVQELCKMNDSSQTPERKRQHYLELLFLPLKTAVSSLVGLLAIYRICYFWNVTKNVHQVEWLFQALKPYGSHSH